MKQHVKMQHDEPIKGVRNLGRRLDPAVPPPLRFVYRDHRCSDGGVVGTITTNPEQIDGVVCRAWKQIYVGNVQCAAEVVRLSVRFAKLPMASDDACHNLGSP